MTTLEIVDNDITFNMISAENCMKQRIINRLKLFLSEWFLSEEEGVDWFSVLETRVSINYITSIIRRELEKDEEVHNVNDINIIANNVTRQASIEFEVDSIYGVIRGVL